MTVNTAAERTVAPGAASDPLAPTIPSVGSARPDPERGRAPLDSIIPGTIAPGTLIGGSYRLMGELGRGAMGVVLHACVALRSPEFDKVVYGAASSLLRLWIARRWS